MPVFKSLVITERKQKTPMTIADYEEPTLAEDEVLIENVAVAQNPFDWKSLDWDFGMPSLPWTPGCEGAGTVYRVGPGVTKFKVGDRVAAFYTRKTARHGAFQTYSIGRVDRTIKLPESYTFESGSTLLATFVTAGAGLAHGLGVKLTAPDGPVPVEKPDAEPLLVWGGASGVGVFVIQLAKYAGYKVIATASPSNHDYVKSLGADYVFDYRAADVVEQIRNVAGKNLSLAYDTVFTDSSTQQAIKSITSPSGGKVAIIFPYDTKLLSTETVQVVETGSGQASSDPELAKEVYGLLDTLLERGILKPHRAKVIRGGLVGVNEGYELGRQNKVSGEKLVYRIADTKF